MSGPMSESKVEDPPSRGSKGRVGRSSPCAFAIRARRTESPTSQVRRSLMPCAG